METPLYTHTIKTIKLQDSESIKMKDLIKIEKSSINGSEVNSVNSREVYEHLDISTPYSMWIRRAIEKYKFIENEDFTVNKIVIRNNAHLDYIVTIDMAKELCMVSNSDKGRETRKYFIEVEKIANKPMTIEQLIQENIKVIGQLQTKVITLQNKVEEDKPKVRFAEAISGTVSNIDFETFAKALYDSEEIKMGRNNLMKWFRDNRYLMKNNKPYQTMLDRGLMTLKEGSYINQSTQEMVTYTQPRITGKGQMYFTNKLLDEAK